MGLRLHNTLTGSVEPFTPLEPGLVRLYCCGPTVYHYAHIGNLRTFVFQDLLRRYLRYRGFALKHVMNITDVEDKIIANANEKGVSLGEYTAEYIDAFLEDLETLGIERPEILPRATEHIDDMVGLILRLREEGLTYQRDGSTYYRIDAFADYGKLSHLDPSEASGGEGRVDSDEYGKDNPRDFVLWKARKPGEAYWSTPLGEGRPGWHIECSAMSMKYLGESFDIHCGGVDLIFPHHENEIAQSEGATHKPFVRCWLHAAHLIVDGEKMSKSKGNFFTLRDLLNKGCSPRPLRYLLQSVHYRRQLNFTFEGTEQAASALRRVDDFLQKVRAVDDGRDDDPELGRQIAQARDGFEAAMDDDLNTSGALGALFELVRLGNTALDEGSVGSGNRDEILNLFADANRIFDVFQVKAPEIADEEILQLIEQRRLARQQRDFDRADAVREELVELGIILEDTKEGTRWKRLH